MEPEYHVTTFQEESLFEFCNVFAADTRTYMSCSFQLSLVPSPPNLKMSIRNIINDPFATGSLSLAAMSWIITFISSIVADVQGSFPKLTWWGIVFELFVILFLAVLYIVDDIQPHRLSIVGFLAIATVYTTNSANSLVYSNTSAKNCAAAGSILLSMINLIWLFYYGTDIANSVLVARVFGKVAPGFSTDRNGVHLALHEKQGSNPFTTPQPNRTYTPNDINNTNTNYMSSGQLTGLEKGVDSNAYGNHDDSDDELSADDHYPITVRALYNYDANPEDINELSLKQGEVFKVKDTAGKWWQAKKQSGELGICPSNYVETLH
ncbi:GQ67_02403T0 [Komagataella phaffii]|nr:GQ67_02403T0 [Komagataella phaffii]AOA65495.1 GQ68_02844T0 [Komagataella phaffii GS115]